MERHSNVKIFSFFLLLPKAFVVCSTSIQFKCNSLPIFNISKRFCRVFVYGLFRRFFNKAIFVKAIDQRIWSLIHEKIIMSKSIMFIELFWNGVSILTFLNCTFLDFSQHCATIHSANGVSDTLSMYSSFVSFMYYNTQSYDAYVCHSENWGQKIIQNPQISYSYFLRLFWGKLSKCPEPIHVQQVLLLSSEL